MCTPNHAPICLSANTLPPPFTHTHAHTHTTADYIPKRGGASPTPVGHFMREQEFIKAAERVGVPQSEAQTLLWDTSASVVSVFVLLEAARSLQETATSEPKTAARIMEVVSTL